MNLSIGFIIKKFISFFLMPMTIAVFLGLIAFWYLHKKNIKKAKLYLVFSLVWVALITSAPVANLLLTPLESQYSRLEKIPDNIEYILLLGGDKKKEHGKQCVCINKIPV